MRILTPSSLALLLVAATNRIEGSTLQETIIATTNITYTAYEQYATLMLTAVNTQRATQGLSPLCLNRKLHNSAQGHSNDMAQHDHMSHSGSDGSTMSERITETGYEWDAVAENVAAGQVDNEEVMLAWIDSPEHLVNIMGEYTMFGVGYAYNREGVYHHFWTQNFGISETEECDYFGYATKAVTPAPTTKEEVPDVENSTPESPPTTWTPAPESFKGKDCESNF